jgi:hypothetical protein
MELPCDSKKDENTVGNFEKEYVRREELAGDSWHSLRIIHPRYRG